MLKNLFATAAALGLVSLATAQLSAAPSSDGSIFFDTFDGPEVGSTSPPTGSVNPSGGTSNFLPAFDHPRFFVSLNREGVQFNVSGATTEQEYYANPTNIPLPTDNYIAEVRWIIDDANVNGENATLLDGYQVTGGFDKALIRLEAKAIGGGQWRVEVAADGNSVNQGLVGPNLDPGVSVKIVAHNLGDGTVDLWINDAFINNYVVAPGSLEYFGNMGNNSSHVGQGGTMLLEYASLGIPEPASLGLLGLGGLMMLRQRR